jgi:hypothetical protein
VIDYVFQRRCAVVVKVRRSVSDPAQPGDIQFVPVVGGGRASNESGQQGAAGIGARTPDFGAGRERNFERPGIRRKFGTPFPGTSPDRLDIWVCPTGSPATQPAS